MIKTHDVVVGARSQLEVLTGLMADNVSDLSHGEDGWRLVVNMVELKRVPATMDVLAAFEVVLDERGNVMSYHRARRYLRDQITEE